MGTTPHMKFLCILKVSHWMALEPMTLPSTHLTFTWGGGAILNLVLIVFVCLFVLFFFKKKLQSQYQSAKSKFLKQETEFQVQTLSKRYVKPPWILPNKILYMISILRCCRSIIFHQYRAKIWILNESLP